MNKSPAKEIGGALYSTRICNLHHDSLVDIVLLPVEGGVRLDDDVLVRGLL